MGTDQYALIDSAKLFKSSVEEGEYKIIFGYYNEKKVKLIYFLLCLFLHAK